MSDKVPQAVLKASGDSEEIPVPVELVQAFKTFMQNGYSGSVQIHFKNGRPAGVETNSRQILR